jgi:hypothetical protein
MPSEYEKASDRDRALMEAFLLYEAAMSPHGFPWREVLDENADGHYTVAPQVDYAQMAVEQWQEENPKPPPGTRLFVEDERKTKRPDMPTQ